MRHRRRHLRASRVSVTGASATSGQLSRSHSSTASPRTRQRSGLKRFGTADVGDISCREDGGREGKVRLGECDLSAAPALPRWSPIHRAGDRPTARIASDPGEVRHELESARQGSCRRARGRRAEMPRLRPSRRRTRPAPVGSIPMRSHVMPGEPRAFVRGGTSSARSRSGSACRRRTTCGRAAPRSVVTAAMPLLRMPTNSARSLLIVITCLRVGVRDDSVVPPSRRSPSFGTSTPARRKRSPRRCPRSGVVREVRIAVRGHRRDRGCLANTRLDPQRAVR